MLWEQGYMQLERPSLSKYERLQYFKEIKLFKDSSCEVYEILCDTVTGKFL